MHGLTYISVKSASFILLQGVPTGISLPEVDEAIRAVEGVEDVHELHVWQLSESKVVASVHVLASRNYDFMQVAVHIREALHDRGIHSSTIQPEYHPASHPQTPVTSCPVSFFLIEELPYVFIHTTNTGLSDRIMPHQLPS